MTKNAEERQWETVKDWHYACMDHSSYTARGAPPKYSDISWQPRDGGNSVGFEVSYDHYQLRENEREPRYKDTKYEVHALFQVNVRPGGLGLTTDGKPRHDELSVLIKISTRVPGPGNDDVSTHLKRKAADLKSAEDFIEKQLDKFVNMYR